MDVKLIQINLGEGASAEDLFMQPAAQREVDIVLMSEPYRAKDLDGWFRDATGRAAIGILSRKLTLTEASSTKFRFIWMEIDGLRIYSRYFSLNDKVEVLQTEI